MPAPSTPIEIAFADRHKRHESRTEQTSCLIVMGVLVACYLISVTAHPTGLPGMFETFSYLTAAGGGVMLILFFLARRGTSLGVIKHVNVAVQVSLVSAVCLIDFLYQGPVFALSSLGPLVYSLVIGLTALRLSPELSISAGLLSAAQFMALYAFVFRAGTDGALLDATKSLGWSITLMKTTVLVAVGLAAALAARQFGRNTRLHVAEALRAQSLQRLFGRYVSPAVAEAVIASDHLLTTRRTHAVILIGDLRGFTRFCEAHPPAEVTALLNDYFEQACRVVEQEGGVMNKFIGDGFLAFFEARLTASAPEAPALRATRRLMQELPAVLDRHALKLGLAASSGEVVLGEIGSKDRCEFSVVGDTVNRTARLEGLNSVLGSTCLLTPELARHLPADVPIADRGDHTLKGLAGTLRVIELLNGPAVAEGKPRGESIGFRTT